jgi:hypothetical protein
MAEWRTLFLGIMFGAGLTSSSLVLPTPMLGWSTWNTFGCRINATLVAESIHALASSPLKASGYNWVLIDDCWTTCKKELPGRNRGCAAPGDRDSDTGRQIVDPVKFPGGFEPLTSLAHSMGVKVGIYTSVSAVTCGGYTGSLHHEAVDAAAYAAWGFDMVKHDTCGRDYSVHDGGMQNATSRMRDALWDAGKGKMVYYLDSGNPTSPQRVFNPYNHGIPKKGASEVQQEALLKLATRPEELAWVWGTRWGRESVVFDSVVSAYGDTAMLHGGGMIDMKDDDVVHDARGRLVDDKGPHMIKSWFDREDTWGSVMTNLHNQARVAEVWYMHYGTLWRYGTCIMEHP